MPNKMFSKVLPLFSLNRIKHSHEGANAQPGAVAALEGDEDLLQPLGVQGELKNIEDLGKFLGFIQNFFC